MNKKKLCYAKKKCIYLQVKICIITLYIIDEKNVIMMLQIFMYENTCTCIQFLHNYNFQLITRGQYC